MADPLPHPVARRYPPVPLLGVATAVWRGERVLLVRRASAPNLGLWAMPGGLAEVGETLEAAARREVEEETRLTLERVVFNRLHEIIIRDADGAAERHFVLAMFAATAPRGLAVAGTDAAAVTWATREDMCALPLTRSTQTFVEEGFALLNGGRR